MSSIIINFQLPGATMYSEKKCAETNNYIHNFMHINVKDKKGKHREHFTIKCRNSVPAIQVLPISEEVVKIWCSNEIPSFLYTENYGKRKLRDDAPNWKKLNKAERIDVYVEGIAHDLNAINYSWEFID